MMQSREVKDGGMLLHGGVGELLQANGTTFGGHDSYSRQSL